MQRYEVVKTVGEGTYGVVLQCRDRERGVFVAVKRFKHFNCNSYVRRTMARELHAQQLLRHEPYVVHLLKAFKEGGTLHLVMDYIEHTLLDVLDSNPDGLPRETVRRLMFTLLIGVRSCHRCGILHRDIKPENILVREEDSTATLCDFGFSRPKLSFSKKSSSMSPLPNVCGDGEEEDATRSSSALSLEGESLENERGMMTDYVATRWYRSPEMLLGFSHYSFPVDMWAVGAIMAEACDGQPLLPGKTELEQIELIQHRIGRLPPNYLSALGARLGSRGYLDVGSEILDLFEEEKEEMTEASSHFLEDRFLPYVGHTGVDLMRRLLTIDSKERITVEDALEHPFFEGLSKLYDPLAAVVMETRVTPVSSPAHSPYLPSPSAPTADPTSTRYGGSFPRKLGDAAETNDVMTVSPSQTAHRLLEEAGLLELSITSSLDEGVTPTGASEGNWISPVKEGALPHASNGVGHSGTGSAPGLSSRALGVSSPNSDEEDDGNVHGADETGARYYIPSSNSNVTRIGGAKDTRQQTPMPIAVNTNQGTGGAMDSLESTLVQGSDDWRTSSVSGKSNSHSGVTRESSSKVPTLLFRSRRSVSPMALSFLAEGNNEASAGETSKGGMEGGGSRGGSRPTPPLRRVVVGSSKVGGGSSNQRSSSGDGEECGIPMAMSYHHGVQLSQSMQRKGNNAGHSNETNASQEPLSARGGASFGQFSFSSQKRLSAFKGNETSLPTVMKTNSTPHVPSPTHPSIVTPTRTTVKSTSDDSSMAFPPSCFALRNSSNAPPNSGRRTIHPDNGSGESTSYLRLSHSGNISFGSKSTDMPEVMGGLFAKTPTSQMPMTKKKQRLVLRE